MTQVNDLQILKAAFIVNQSLDKEECIKGMFYIMFVKRKSRVKYCSFHLLTQEVISCVWQVSKKIGIFAVLEFLWE